MIPETKWSDFTMAGGHDDLELLVSTARLGDVEAATSLDRRLYEELRALAASMMRAQPSGHTLQPTALVHEAFLKTDGFIRRLGVDDRAHLFRSIAKAMRQLLIDSARRKATEKHGGGRQRAPAEAIEREVIGAGPSEADPESFAEVSRVVDQLDTEDPRAAEVVRLKVFAGCSVQQIAEVLGTSERTVAREWEFARRWIISRLNRDN